MTTAGVWIILLAHDICDTTRTRQEVALSSQGLAVVCGLLFAKLESKKGSPLPGAGLFLVPGAFLFSGDGGGLPSHF